jgi:hypothetical protein
MVGENQAWRCSGAGSWRLCDGGAQFAEHLGRDLDARKTTAHDQDVILTGGFRADRQCADMIVEQRAGFECVDIEGIGLKTGNSWLGQAAAKSEDEPVIGQGLRSAIHRANDLSLEDINVRDSRHDVLDADRAEHIC